MAFVRTAISTTGNTTLNSATLTVASNAGMFVGMCIYGTGIKPDTIINAISGTTITMSLTASATGTGVAVTGQYITQSGTDTDPSGLAAIVGVTSNVEGTGSSLTARYNLGLNQFRVTGNFTHNGDQYCIVANVQQSIIIEGGIYNYGIEKIVNGKYSYSKGCGLDLTYKGGIASNFPIQLRSGQFNWKGGIIRFGGAFSMTGGKFNQKGDTSVAYNNNSGTQIQLRTILAPADMIYDRIKLAGDNTTFFWTTQTYGAISAALENGAVQTPAGFSATQSYDNFIFANNQAVADFYINQLSGASSTRSIVKNPDVIPRVSQLNTGAYGVVETRISLQINVKDENNQIASNISAYLKDSNNGARTNENQLIYNDDFEYFATGNGSLNLGDVLVNVQMRNPAATSTVKHDYRGNFGATSFDFIIYLGGYDFIPVPTRQSLIGNGGKTEGLTMYFDKNPTLSMANALLKLASSFTIAPITKTITVTANSALEDLYDSAKAYKYNGTKDNILVPSVDKLLVEANGEILRVAEDWNLVLGPGVSLSKGVKFKQLKLTGTGLLTNNGTINFPYADALGSRVLVTNLDPQAFGVIWYLRYKKTSESVWINVSGTGNNSNILMDLGQYTIMARVPGYDWKTLDFDTNESLLIDLNLQYHVSANNTPQYTMTFDAALEANIQYDPAKQAVAVENTTGTITQPGFAELYQATQRIQHIPNLVWIWTDPVTANSTSQKILIPTGNPISFFLTEASNATVKVTCPVIHLTSGQSADDRVKGNSSGYSIILGSPATAESAGLQSAIVSDLMAKLGGTGFEVDTHSLVNVKATVNALENYDDTILQGKADDIKAKTDILENYNDATVQSKLDGLATDLDSVALESTAQAIKAKTDTLVNYNDATAQAKLDAIKAKTDTLSDMALESTSQEILTAVSSIDTASIEQDLQVINKGVQDASLFIPHTTDL